MNNSNTIKLFLLLGSIGSLMLACQPLGAAIFQPSSPSSSNVQLNHRYATGVGKLIDSLRRPKVPGGSRGDDEDQVVVCGIVPGRLFDPASGDTTTIKMWTLDPAFVWQDDWTILEVKHHRSNDIIARATLLPGQRHLLYSDIDNAQPLEPGQAYYWRLSNGNTFGEISFRIMRPNERTDIDAVLNALPQNPGDSTHTMWQERTEFFLESGLWADAFREVYANPNPSAEILDLRTTIESHDYCPDEEETESVTSMTVPD